jgi:hypothetical protein
MNGMEGSVAPETGNGQQKSDGRLLIAQAVAFDIIDDDCGQFWTEVRAPLVQHESRLEAAD